MRSAKNSRASLSTGADSPSSPPTTLAGKVWTVAFPVLLLTLMIGGSFAGMYGLTRAADAVGLLAVQPALKIPASLAGIALGGMTGLAVALGCAALPLLVRKGGLGRVGRTVFAAVGATLFGVVSYLVAVGGLVWLVGLVLPELLTSVVAILLSVAGVPVAGPIAYQLISGRRADEVGGGMPLPDWVYRLRRRERRPTDPR